MKCKLDYLSIHYYKDPSTFKTKKHLLSRFSNMMNFWLSMLNNWCYYIMTKLRHEFRKFNNEDMIIYAFIWINTLMLIIITAFEKITLTYYHHCILHFRLAVSDCLLIVDSFVQKSIIPHFTNKSPADPLWFKVSFPYIWHPFKGVIVTITIYMIVAVSAERFRAVCYPLSKRHVRV